MLDIAGRQLIVHRGPAQGRYERIQVLTGRDAAVVESHPDLSIPVAEVLP